MASSDPFPSGATASGVQLIILNGIYRSITDIEIATIATARRILRLSAGLILQWLFCVSFWIAFGVAMACTVGGDLHFVCVLCVLCTPRCMERVSVVVRAVDAFR